MGIEPNNEGSGSVLFGQCYSSGSVRVRLILSSGSVRFDQLYGSGSVRLMRGSQLQIWFGHNCKCKKLGALKKVTLTPNKRIKCKPITPVDSPFSACIAICSAVDRSDCGCGNRTHYGEFEFGSVRST